MNRSSEDIEREVESARGELDRTVEALKDKMTPGQLIDEISRSFKGGGAGEMMSNLGVQVRENPVALAMIGAGVAWLMMGRGDHEASDALARTYQSNPDMDIARPSSSSHGVSGKAEHLADKVSEAASGVKDAISNVTDRATESLHDLRGQAGAAGRKTARSFEDILQQEPLIIGALGLAVGVAVGAALPATSLEDRTFGAARDDLVEAGQEKLAAAAQGLRASGEAAIAAAKQEAGDQGLTGDDGSLVDKAESVVRSGVEAARSGSGADRPT